MQQRYSQHQNWYKGNTHIHSIVSDGALDFAQLAARYKEAGYDFLCRTDHWIASDASKDSSAKAILWLDGVELDGLDRTGVYFHIVCLGTFTGIERGMDLEDAVQAARRQGGLVVLAHPHWTGNSLADALRLPFDGMEVYNNVCQGMNGKGESGELWDALLEYRADMLCFASDDAHLSEDDPGWNGGWIMVNAAECKPDALMGAIRRGDFYSTTGPSFEEIRCDSKQVRVRTSPVKFIRLVGPRYHCKKAIAGNGETLNEATFTIPEGWTSAYIQIEDGERRKAWTNPLDRQTD